MIVHRRQWDSRAAFSLADALGADTPTIARQVIDGTAELFEFENLGHVVTRMEATAEGPELVIVGGQGRGGDIVVPVLIDAARHNGAVSVRAHSSKLSMGRYLARFGFTERERVYGRKIVK